MKGPRRSVFFGFLVVVLLLFSANAWLAMSFVTISPGWARPAGALVRVEGAESAGNLLYAVVRTRPANLLDVAHSLANSLVEVRRAEKHRAWVGGWEEYSRAMRDEMQKSRAVAALVALRALGYLPEPGAVPAGVEREPPFANIDFPEGEVAGGSAGLMMALELYAQLAPGIFSTRWVIAGTGELDADGTVHPVDGVPQKIAASLAAGAEVFLIPRTNLDEAQGLSGKIKLIPVDTFEQAVAALIRLGLED